MARRPHNKGKKCVRRKRVAGGKMRCAKFGSAGSSGSRKRSGGSKKRCLKWSKSGKKRCLKRAKR